MDTQNTFLSYRLYILQYYQILCDLEFEVKVSLDENDHDLEIFHEKYSLPKLMARKLLFKQKCYLS